MTNPDATHPSEDRRPEPVVGASLPAGLQKAVGEATRTLWNQDGTPTARYKIYQHYRGVYEAAVTRLNRGFEEAQTDPNASARWPVVGEGLQMDVDSAFTDWIGSRYKSEIDAALDILASVGKAPP